MVLVLLYKVCIYTYIYLGTWLVGYYVTAMHNSAQTALTFSPTTGYALTRKWKRGLWSIQAGFVR